MNCPQCATCFVYCKEAFICNESEPKSFQMEARLMNHELMIKVAVSLRQFAASESLLWKRFRFNFILWNESFYEISTCLDVAAWTSLTIELIQEWYEFSSRWTSSISIEASFDFPKLFFSPFKWEAKIWLLWVDGSMLLILIFFLASAGANVDARIIIAYGFKKIRIWDSLTSEEISKAFVWRVYERKNKVFMLFLEAPRNASMLLKILMFYKAEEETWKCFSSCCINWMGLHHHRKYNISVHTTNWKAS